MQIPVRTLVLGSLIAFGASPVRAQSKAPEPTPPLAPAATQPSTPIDLSLPAAPVDPLLAPAAKPPIAAPVDPLLAPAAKPTTPPVGPSLPATATPAQPAPVDLRLHPAPAAALPSGPVDVLQSASEEVKRVVRWVVASGDNARLPFLLIDKLNAQVLVFSPGGQLQGAAPALLGMGRGDRMLVSNDTKMSQMPPNVRITPAGRFVSRLAKDSKGKELLVLDYDASLSLHPVVPGTPKERRAERLKSTTPEDNRISFGCINVPVPFYKAVVSPAFTGTKGIVYVLPETSTASALFGIEPVGTAVSAAPLSSPALTAPAAAPSSVPAPDAR